MSNKLFASGTVHDHISCSYGLSGILGGVAAGFFSWAHGYFVDFSLTACNEPVVAPKDAINEPVTHKKDEENAHGAITN
jgi:hypothetical protein